MAWIILETSCGISGVPYMAGPSPIEVSDADAKTLIQMRYARPAEPPVSQPQVRPEPKQPKRPSASPSSIDP